MKQVIFTKAAPAAIGPYSQAVKISRTATLVFCSGQIAIDPDTGLLIGSGDAKVEAERVLQNLAAVLEAAGSSFDRVLKTTIYLTNMADFADVNEVYGRYLGASAPARATVGVGGLPKGACVEIDAIAWSD